MSESLDSDFETFKAKSQKQDWVGVALTNSSIKLQHWNRPTIYTFQSRICKPLLCMFSITVFGKNVFWILKTPFLIIQYIKGYVYLQITGCWFDQTFCFGNPTLQIFIYPCKHDFSLYTIYMYLQHIYLYFHYTCR